MKFGGGGSTQKPKNTQFYLKFLFWVFGFLWVFIGFFEEIVYKVLKVHLWSLKVMLALLKFDLNTMLPW